MINRYLRKPIQVEAYQLTVDNVEELAAWCNGRWEKSNVMTGRATTITIVTDNGYKTVNIGDWIIKDSFPLDNMKFTTLTNIDFLQTHNPIK